MSVIGKANHSNDASEHRQEACVWSTVSGVDGANSAVSASGGNDNKVCIRDLRGTQRGLVDPEGSGAAVEVPRAHSTLLRSRLLLGIPIFKVSWLQVEALNIDTS
jgi:hypothetical protein